LNLPLKGEAMDSPDREDKLTMSHREMLKTMGVAAAGEQWDGVWRLASL
jgi:hypothetical protein